MGAMVYSQSLANNGSLGVKPKYKRRRVSAIRDYPPGCGRFASSMREVTRSVEDDRHDTAEKTNKVLATPSFGALGNENNPQTSDVFTNSSPARMDELKDGMKLKEAIPGNRQASINNVPSEAAPVVRCESFDMLKKVNVDCRQGEAVLPSTSETGNLSRDVLTAGLEKARTRRFPPRGRVSAIRDYPPGCGRFASCPSDNKYVEVESPQKYKDLGGPNSFSDAKAFGKMVNDEQKMEGKYIKQGEACTVVLEEDKEKYEEKNRSKVVIEEENGWLMVVKDGTYGFLVEEKMRNDAEMYQDHNLPEKLSLVASYQHHLENDIEGLEVASDRVVVQGLMAPQLCPWIWGQNIEHLTGGSRNRKGKEVGLGKTCQLLAGGSSSRKGKEVGFFARLEGPKRATKSKNVRNHSYVKSLKKKPSASGSVDKIISCDDSDDDDDVLGQEHTGDLQLAHLPGNVEVNGFPPRSGVLSIESGNNNSNATRHKVKEALRLFQAVCRKLLHIDEAKSKEEKGRHKRVDLHASKMVKAANKYVNKEKTLGSVPGVEVGDEFQYRVELNMVGLHFQIQGGIDYMKHKGKILATSIVASGGYADELDNSDVLIYVGQGGNVMNADKEPEDQKLERGNLALKNSCEEKTPVRVVRGSESVDGKSKVLVYDGLYVVERYWQEVGSHGKMVFRFRLCRIPGQPELAWKELKKSKRLKGRAGLCVEDISLGKEKFPICALNTVDDEKPPPFIYITRMIYPNWCNPIPPRGCYCTDGCLDSENCSCAVKNGGEIPYNHNGAIVEAKALVYECGPSCKCPLSCHNRVTQHGIKFPLEIFKTETRGWGVRSLNSIPSGSFICEYIGELLDDTEAEKRAGSDEYLFDIGKNYNDNSVWNELSNLMPDETHSSPSEGVEDCGFTIDAAHYGNVGRFINHSCNPNLYAQDVLHDHEDRRIPHVMLFAMDNIPPLQELTYHYNYVIDQVFDSRGNIKRKNCYCGSVDCTGRMY